MRKTVGGLITVAVLSVPAAPAAAGDQMSNDSSCVAQFAVPQAQTGAFGETVRAFPDIFHPLGETVAANAQSPRGECLFKPPG